MALHTARIAPQQASYLLAFVPAVMALWYAFGFLQPVEPSGQGAVGTSPSGQHLPASTAPDFGLLLSSAGWALAALSLLIPAAAPVNAAAAANNAAAANPNSMTIAVCGVLAVLCIGCGAVLSLRTWNEHRALNS
jgi:hypothetical protein